MIEEWTISAQRIDNSEVYAKIETIESYQVKTWLEHDKIVKELCEKYKDDDHVRVVGPQHMFYKDTNLGTHYI